MTSNCKDLPSASAAVSGKLGRLIRLDGSNFSGRSDFIVECERLTRSQGHLAIIIPPDLPVSGLALTVEDELGIHLGPRSPSRFWHLAEEWGLSALSRRNLRHLSGGQTALLVILSKLALKPHFLGLDSALEQLDQANINRVLAALETDDLLPESAVCIIAHNGVLPSRILAIRSESASAPSDTVPALNGISLTHAPLERRFDLRMIGATFAYPNHPHVFQNLNIHLESGKIHRLAGPNGSGKSTLALILLGHLRLNAGKILAGEIVTDPYQTPGALATYHFQRPDDQLFESSVSEEIGTLPFEVREQALEFGGLSTLKGQHPFDLPYVLRKRLALSVVLPLRTPWQIIDEPTLGQDERNRVQLAKALRSIADSGRGVLLITHDDSFAKGLVDSTIKIHPNHE